MKHFTALTLTFLLTISIVGCISPTIQYSHRRHIMRDAMKGCLAGTRGTLEGRKAAREKQEKVDAIIRDRIRLLGPPTRSLIHNGQMAYFWEGMTIETVISKLGTPDNFQIYQGLNMYRYGSYIFADSDFENKGVLCVHE